MTNQQGAPEALRVEAAYGGDGKFIGYRLLSSGANGGLLVWADQKAMPGFRIGDHFVPGYREVIEYKPVALVEAQQPAAHVQKPAEIEHVAGDVSKNWAESNMAQQPAPSAAVVGDNRVPEAWTNLLAYVLQDDLHNRLTPRVIDIAYTAFMQAKRPNDEDGGASDWFNDTRPMVRELIAKLRKDLIEELAGAPQPSPTPQADSQPAPVLDDAFDCACVALNNFSDRASIALILETLRNRVDRVVLAAARAPADSVTAPAGGVGGDVDAIALSRYKVVPAHESMFHRFAVVAGDGKQQLYLGREVECENMARKFAGAFLDGAFYQANIAPTPPAQAADSVLEDAARLDFLASAPEGCVRMDTSGGLCPSYIYWGTSDYYSNAGRNDAGNFIGPTPRAAIDAARKQGANHDQ